MKRITFLMLFAIMGMVANAQIYRYVKVSASGTGDGTSWTNAAGTANIQTIIDEVAAATNQGTVYFAAGTYLITAQIQLKNNVQLMGGYAADGSGTRDLLNNQTILDGQFQRRILFTGDQTPYVAFDKVTKVDGFVLQRGSSSYGSAVAMSVGTVLENCIIRNNNGSTFGAAVFIKLHATLSNPTAGWNIGGALINCVIINNTSSDRAAGIFVNQDTHVSIINCVIANNRSTDNSNGVGGVLVQNNIRWSRISNNIIYNNESPVSGRNNFFNPGVNGNQSENTIKFREIWSNYFTDFNTMYLASEVINANPAHGNLTAANFAVPLFEMPTPFRGHSNDAELRIQIENSNWRLASSSPLIGLGFTLSGRVDITYPYSNSRFNNAARAFTTVTTDIQGNTRVINTTVEMGAYEYDAITSTISSSNNSHGTVNANQEVSKGSKINQTATPEAGYRFINWTENGTEVSVAPTYTFTAISNRTLVANFASNTVSLSSSINASATTLNNCENCDVTINEGATFTVDVTKTLKSVTVAAGGRLTLNAGALSTTNGIILQNTASGTASFVDERSADNPTAIAGTIEQTITETNRNWYVSVPVASKTASDITLSGSKIVQRNEIQSRWDDVASGTELTSGKGYIAVASSTGGNTTWSLSGNLKSGKVEVDVTRSGSSSTGFNLLGNPYPSYLNWEQVLNLNATNATLLQGSIWYRTATYNDTQNKFDYTFNTYNSAGRIATPTGTTGYIPPMQAFWVRANSAGTVTFTNAMRSHGNGESNKLKAPSVNGQQVLRLQVSNATANDEAVIYFDENAQNGFDKYDTEKMFNNIATKPEIFTQVGHEKLIINGLNSIQYETEIPLGFATGEASDFKISLREMKNFEVGTRLILRDIMNPTAEVDLSEETSYDFSSAVTAANSNRFSILFRAPSTTTNVAMTSNINTFVFVNISNRIEIIAPAKSDYSIYNTAGQIIESGKLLSNQQTVNSTFAKGIYIVKVNNHISRISIK